jgi:hypothetical protein
MTILLVASQFAILFLLGVAALAPVDPQLREKLLPAAPAFGAGLLAVVSNWGSRWLSVRQTLPIFLVVAVALLVHGRRKGHSPWIFSRRGLCGVALSLTACVGGLTLASVPVAVVGDTNAVASTYIIDSFYFGGVSTYLVDHPVLPGPRVTSSWVANDPPATAPAADTVKNRLRFGQSAVAAALSLVVFHTPYETVSSVSLLLLLLLGGATFAAGTLLGLPKRGAFVASLLVTSSFFIVAQSLQSQNDGLLGASLFLLVLALSISLLKDERYSWPMVLMGAGLAASYSEYFVLLVPAVLGMALFGRRADFRHRLNLLSGRWALSVVLVPWAWVWLAQSLKVTSRFTDGPTPFKGRSGWELLRTYMGMTTSSGHLTYSLVLTLAGAVVLLAMLVGWGFAIAWHRGSITLVPLLLIVTALELFAAGRHLGNLQFRVLQLAMPALLLFAVVGWDLLLAPTRPFAHGRVRRPSTRRLRAVASLSACAMFAGSNLVSVGLTTSHDRARNQHIPAAFMADVLHLVRQVGPSKVTVVAPVLTDLSALSMALSRYPQVQYPSVFPLASYVGVEPHWDRQPDPYYVVGPGSTVLGGATYRVRSGRYAIVQLQKSGLIIAPFDAGWSRTTWMRGFPCARPGVKMLIIRGGTAAQTFRIAAATPSGKEVDLQLLGEDGAAIPTRATPAVVAGWTTETFRAPRTWNSIASIELDLRPSPDGSAGVPLRFSSERLPLPATGAVAAGLTATCETDFDSGMDGYDRELTTMRAAP